MYKFAFFLIFSFFSLCGYTQVLNQQLNHDHCGSFHLMENMDNKSEGFLHTSEEFILNLKKVIKNKNAQKAQNDVFRVPVVFHILHNEEEENLPDSVIFNQIEVLNECFRRTNPDAEDLREEFIPYVGDAFIEFYLAETDPEGQSTNGINRVETDITYFGGELPYIQSQTSEIVEWFNDVFFDNVFRMTNQEEGGSDPWDTERYLNIWVGDLRVFEPMINNFEELVFFGLATPPLDHYNFPQELIAPFNGYARGVLLHYVAVGGNNPVNYPFPYQAFNSSVKSGKMAVHEIGHYLGLRHTWGDGDCSMDDFIDDTPSKSASEAYNCSFSGNSCVDDIDGVDLPDMIENYMDYASATCQNSFTIGQIEVMREVFELYYPDLAEVVLSTDEIMDSADFIMYPNPASDKITVQVNTYRPASTAQISISDLTGRIHANIPVKQDDLKNQKFSLDVSYLESGYYQVHLVFDDLKISRRWLKL